ncbi:hypothetical protein BDW66DRAFT_151504 [Aspergillus desertorum]
MAQPSHGPNDVCTSAVDEEVVRELPAYPYAYDYGYGSRAGAETAGDDAYNAESEDRDQDDAQLKSDPHCSTEHFGGAQHHSSNSGLKMKLDLNLDVEVELKAQIHGDLTLALL